MEALHFYSMTKTTTKPKPKKLDRYRLNKIAKINAHIPYL